MSADNGIYIGAFPKMEHDTNIEIQDCSNVHEMYDNFEYRVIHAQAIDNLYWTPTDSYKENPREIFNYFKDATVQNQRDAHEQAFILEQQILNDSYCPILEYGINTLKFLHPFSYYQEHAHEIVYRWDKKEDQNNG